ncbi:Sulfotransferase domain, partial [Trinorchestia longiramus]
FTFPDVMVMTYPKCGTTWVQEVVWTMRNNPDLDNPAAAESINFRVPFLEMDGLMVSKTIPPPPVESPFMKSFFEACPRGDPADGIFIQIAQALPQPRTFKTHLPFSLMPGDLLEKTKVVYVMREPKDLVVSFMHHCRLFNNHAYVGTDDNFVDTFINGNVVYGSYDLHVKEAIERRSHPNLHIVRFEDMKATPKAELQRLDIFLGTGLTKEQIEKVAQYTSFDEMKKRDNVLGKKPEQNPIVNATVLSNEGGFYRKGEAGSWSKTLTKEQAARIEKWQAEKFKGTVVNFSGN